MLRSKLVAIAGTQSQSKDARTMFSTYEAYSYTNVKHGYKRTQYYHSYTTTKAYDSLARI
jgi:hypothetical protein